MANIPTCILLVAAVFLVGTMIPPAMAQKCYQIRPEILCDEGKVEPECLPFCNNKFGSSAGGQCIEQLGFNGPFCACDYPC
ncbi:uncharacterized protein LOC107874556 isoform X2 [Capsicum annuum]|uniref:uncharacterized protein LOC107874556 isoform X2 n=1 Tax=Capsicum annuum TaxID=4072 RepID=UPI0007BF37D3|nr:uncharacterized protein LOC107874556 isoform X2 [Capsicum annuum]